MKKIINILGLIVLLSLVAGCSGLKVPQTMNHQNQMVEAKHIADTAVYINENINQIIYQNFILEPVSVYDGEDSDFGSIPEEDKAIMADYMKEEFIEAFEGSQFKIVQNPAPATLRVKFTLIGLTRSVPVVQGLNYVAWPVGTGIQMAKGALGKSGTFMGNATFVAEFTDSVTGDVVASLVTKQSANALNFSAAFGGKYNSAKSGIRDFMQTMRQRADEQHGFK